VMLAVGRHKANLTLVAEKAEVSVENLKLTQGDHEVEASAQGDKKAGPKYVELERRGD
jgi:hypothetical protein